MNEDLIARKHSLPLYVISSSGPLEDQLKLHLDNACLPKTAGVAKRVIQALSNRIGHSPMDIQTIANELHLSKRTLQRRLQQQGFSYSELRDGVRRQYAVATILEGKRRVDDIYTDLDFADRSSLTLAFKRWTGFSPRAFGRLYRDYR